MNSKELGDNQNQANELNHINEQNQMQMQIQSNENNILDECMNNYEGNNEFLNEVDERLDNNEENNRPSPSTNFGTGTVENRHIDSIPSFVGSNNNKTAHNQNPNQETPSNITPLFLNLNINNTFKLIQANLNLCDKDESTKKHNTEINTYDNGFHTNYFNNLSQPPDEGQVNKYYGTEDEKLNSENYINANMNYNQSDNEVNNEKRNNNPPIIPPNDEAI